MSEFRTCMLWYYGTAIALTSVCTAIKYGTSVRRSTDNIWELLKKLHRNFLEIYGNFPPTLESEKFLMYSYGILVRTNKDKE